MFLLQLHPDQTVTWLECNELGEILSMRLFSDLSQCPKINKENKLMVLIPGEKVIMTRVKLPKMRASEKSQAIVYALEEQLASDPEKMAVMTGESQTNGLITAAIIEKEIIHETVHALQAANLYPQCLLPDFLGITWKPETWSVVLQHNMALVRTDLQQGFSVDIDNLFLLLQLLLNKNKIPTEINCWQQDNIVDIRQSEKLNVPFHVFDKSKNEFLDVRNLFLNPAINFLQGKYRQKTQISTLRTHWIGCGSAFAALIFFLFFSNIVQWIYFRHESRILQTKITQIYQTLFPGAKSVLEPHFRVAALLKKYEGASEANVFLHAYELLGQTLLHFPDMHAQSVVFNKKQLQVTVQGKSLQNLTAFSKMLQKKGLQTSQQILKNNPNDVEAEVIVS